MPSFLPPAYVVRQEGNVLTRVCPGWGDPSQVQMGGTPPQARSRGGISPPPQVQMGQPDPDGRDRGGQPGPDGDTPAPSPQDRTAYGVLDTRWAYASCVHAGGLSCSEYFLLLIHDRSIVRTSTLNTKHEQFSWYFFISWYNNLFQRDKSRRMCSSNTRTSVFYWFVGDGKFSQVMSDHFRAEI